ncbi:MAG: transcriptional regulator [Chlorobiaceae bacterium]|nr:transcriptional regulator [Chlorobiales bacterium]NTU91855.1 transcriptional regulator [Chlorobiaceae bacterium]NTV25596.1 transcriptional regulator [Chlorobiaceae bacterium]
MKTCPFSGLPVTAKPHWKEEQPGYIKRLELIGDDILHAFIEARHPVSLHTLSNNLVKTVLRESGIPDKPLYLVWDMNNINDVSYEYKQGISDLIYHWGPAFTAVVFYNIDPSCRIILESFAAIVPNNMTVLLRENYREAIECVMDFRSGKALPDEVNAAAANEESELRREFLAAVARISWLNMLNHKIALPPENSSFYPYFKALDHMQNDLQAREELHEQEVQRLKNECEQRLTQKIILLNAQIELNRKELLQHEQERASLKSRISAQEMELTRISTAIGEKTSALHQLHEQIKSLDIDQQVRQRMAEQCQSMLETELTEKRLKTELTAGDSEFLSKLQKKHPNLNQRELRVGLMVKLNYDTREIARAIGISTRGMESIRYRMHKKLNLDKHKSIKTYLSELATEQ